MDKQCGFMQLAAQRCSVRRFDSRPIEPEVMEKILCAGRLAPTACNLQPQRILTLSDPEDMARLRKCTVCHFNAPAALLVCYDKSRCWVRDYDGKSSGDIDASIVTAHMMLAAQALGVGSTWVMYFIPEAIREELQVPADYEPTALLMLGYPAPDAKPAPAHTDRLPLDKTVFFGKF